MNIFYLPELSHTDKLAYLSEEESKHACRVLRMKKGSEILIMNGKGSHFYGQITDDNPKKCEIKIKEFVFEEIGNKQIHIAICPTKNFDRTEWFLEKATELGIDEISFVISKNSERKQVKMDRVEKIIIAASKQCQRKYLPILNEALKFEDFIKKYPMGAIAHCYSGDKLGIKNNLQKKNYPILIGPEGDFTKEEVTFALKAKYDPISLGKNRLRTETAALYATMLVKTYLEQ